MAADTCSKLVPGSWLTSASSRYQVLSILGEGTFGKVTKCVRMADKKTVAIKVMKHEGSSMANQEVAVLRKLSMYNSYKHNLVEWYQVFMDQGRACLEFEYLDKSLFDFMQERHFQPLSLKAIRPIVVQIAVALDHLKAVGIIHADLKLENVMLVNHQQEPYRIKVIDLGLACNASEARVNSYIQSRPYRSPEIILGLPFREAIDVWSLGCIATALYLGCLLYPGNNEYEMMRYIVETQGQPTDKMLDCGKKTSWFFNKEFNSTTNNWKLKTPEQVFQESGIWFTESRKRRLTSLDDLVHLRQSRYQQYADKAAEMCDVLMFVEMVKEMLQLDPQRRCTPHQVLEHPFSKMTHMACLYKLSSYVKSCYEHVNICQKKSPVSSDSGTGVSRSLLQTRQPAQQRVPPPAAESKIRVSPPSSRTTSSPQQNCPPSSTQRRSPKFFKPICDGTAQTASANFNFKRRRHEEDMTDTSQSVKKRRTCWQDVGENTPTSSQYERSKYDQSQLQDAPGPSSWEQISFSFKKRKMDHGETTFDRSHKCPRKCDEDRWGFLYAESRQILPKHNLVEDHRCREARGAGRHQNSPGIWERRETRGL